MPSTVNGCGTYYYGKSNKKVRNGVCRRCHREANLESYDTRLFIVIVLIPVWPLGRKRIIDSCPFCTGHYVMPARQWEVAGQLNISDALARFTNEPSADSASRAHGQLLSYFQYDEARSLREKALATLPDDGALRAELGWQMHALDQHAEALQLFDEALRLRPDLPSARSGKAQYLTGQGKLDEASALLDFLKEPGAGQIYDLRPLLFLFEQLHHAKRSDEALDLAQHILQELPALKDDYWFRNTVRQAERASGRHESLLPQQNRSLFSLLFSNSRDFSPHARGWARFAVLAAGILVALVLHNESVRRRRTVYVLNQTGVPAQVRVDGQPAVAVDVQSSFVVPEGEHDVQISGPVESTEKLVVRSGYFARWFQRPVWLVNVNGEAVVVKSDIVYSSVHTPSIFNFHLGETVLAFPNIDYLFDEELPKSISVKENENVVKEQLQVMPLPAEIVLASLAERNPAGALTMAEKRLTRLSDTRLLDVYKMAARERGLQDRAARFLEAGLDRRPIDIPWHRAYQDLRDVPATAGQMLARYEHLTEQEPDSPAVWYLYARRNPDIACGDRSIAKALELDSQFGWALYAQGHRALNRGEWELAEQSLTAALAAPGREDAWQFEKICSLLVQQKFDAVDEECARWTDARHNMVISIVRFWSKHKRKLPVDTAALIAKATAGYPAESAQAVRLTLELLFEYAKGNWDVLRNLQKNPQLTGFAPSEKALQLISTMSLDELKNQFPQPAGVADGQDALAIGLAFGLAGDAQVADAWRKRAIERLRQGDFDERRVAEALDGEAPPTLEEVRNIPLDVVQKLPLVCAALAQRFPEQRGPFLEEARRWQLLPLKYYWLVERAIQQSGEQAP